MKKFLMLFFVKKAFIFSLFFIPVFASAAPAYSAKMGQAIGGVMEHKAIQRGFAANDPRFGSAVAATGAVLTAAATGVIAVSGAPLWVTIGLGALASGLVSLAVDSAVDWIFNDDGTATYTPPGTAPSGDYGSNRFFVGKTYNNKSVTGSDPQAIAMAVINYGESGSFTSSGTDLPWRWDVVGRDSGSNRYYFAGAFVRGSDVWIRSTTISGFPSNPNPGSTPDYEAGTSAPVPINKPVGDLADSLTPEKKALPVNPKIIADITNQAWKKAAAQPDYQGLPYSYSDPVTTADVEAWRVSNPSSYPTVGDAVSSAYNPSTGSVPVTLPGQVTNPSTGIPTAPAGSTKVDLGIDPGIGAPNLEATPTGSQVLAPITGLMPDLRNFQVPSHQAECPKPEFDIAILHTRVRMDAHCTLFEGVRGSLYNGSLVAWLIAALFIVLSA